MTLPTDMAPPGNDYILRRIAQIERQLREFAAGRGLESASIGAGGIRIRGGEIRIQDETGTIDLAVLSSDGIVIGGNPLILPGSIAMFAGPAGNVPIGWLVANGAAVSRTIYSELFAAIGTTWGTGDGSTTFNLPDLRNRFMVGAGSTFTVGDTGGSSTHTHSNPNTDSSGSHDHGSAGSHNHGGDTGGIAAVITSQFGGTSGSTFNNHTHSISSSGAHTHGTDGAHTHTQGNTGSTNHTPPYAALTPIIRY